MAEYINGIVQGFVAPNEETAAQLAQECCKARAAYEGYMADRLAVLKDTTVHAERVRARLQEEKARAQAMVSADTISSTAALTVDACRQEHPASRVLFLASINRMNHSVNPSTSICAGGAYDSSTSRGRAQPAREGQPASSGRACAKETGQEGSQAAGKS